MTVASVREQATTDLPQFADIFANRSPGEWSPWFDRDENGVITSAGVDEPTFQQNVAMTSCEDLDVVDSEQFNSCVEADTTLLALATMLPDALDALAEALPKLQDGANDELAARIERILTKARKRI